MVADLRHGSIRRFLASPVLRVAGALCAGEGGQSDGPRGTPDAPSLGTAAHLATHIRGGAVVCRGRCGTHNRARDKPQRTAETVGAAGAAGAAGAWASRNWNTSVVSTPGKTPVGIAASSELFSRALGIE